VVEASWSIYANHGGGYSYRICKKGGGAEATEECYQQRPLDFATETTQIRYVDGSRAPFFINATTTNQGTWPAGSQWRKNPIPMCNCDIGTGCGHKESVAAQRAMSEVEGGATADADLTDIITGGKQCKEVLHEFCGTKTGENTCLRCGSKSSYDCEECCPGLDKVTKGGYSYCVSHNPSSTCSKDNPRACFGEPYPNSYLAPGQQVAECPTGLMFPSAWDAGAGAGIGGSFNFEMVDKLQVPDVPPGEYSLSWRWDCEQTPQVWNSCADVAITA